MDTVEIKNLTKSFKKVDVLKGINLNIERGQVLALLGPNGAGKTTIIRILSTLLQPDGGEVFVNGFDVVKEPRQVRQNIGLTGQYTALDEFLTGLENLEMFGKLHHLSNYKERARELLEQFDLVEAGKRRVKTYSGGMRRRLDLATSLIATPSVIFLDEPTTGLDPRSRLTMWKIIEKFVESKITILLTTQYLEEADRLADQIAVLDEGKIIAQGTNEELKAMVGKERLELTVQNSNDLVKAKELLKNYKIEIDNEHNSINIIMDGNVKNVKIILNQMEESNIDLAGLNLHKPTLDDVFFHLTGHKTVNENNSENNNQKYEQH